MIIAWPSIYGSQSVPAYSLQFEMHITEAHDWWTIDWHNAQVVDCCSLTLILILRRQLQARQAQTSSDGPGPHDPIVLPARTASKSWSDHSSSVWPSSEAYSETFHSSIQVQLISSSQSLFRTCIYPCACDHDKAGSELPFLAHAECIL